ncbi:hypothetical protein Rhopal_003128-T1 [Rhodotorula paludigena]|uniref:NmrA-like domain-containing protein n=1 Tax=Rhodotorula paludigena TaxID=86838 RepID=A0AAV5GI47_9BASI|nr:hypothetical protein Rhopal_003128-T1 [Rhodotorula paludigena]
MSLEIIAVIGATGYQGSGVVANLLASTSFVVRAISSNVNGGKARTLAVNHKAAVDAGRLIMMEANLDDRESLEKAFEGSYGVFVAQAPGPTEVQQGRNIVDAAKTTGVRHAVFSSLPGIKTASNGKYAVAPFDNKEEIANYARQQLATTTFVIPANLSAPFYCHRREDGVAKFCGPGMNIEWVDDQHDVGVFAAAIFTTGPAITAGKTYPLASKAQTLKQIAQTYEAITGDPSVWEPLTPEQRAAFLPPFLVSAIENMYGYFEEIDSSKTCYGTMDPKDDTSFQDLGVKASTVEEWLARTGWRAPGFRAKSA